MADEEGNSQEVYDDKSENEMDNANDGLEENIFEARSLLLKNVIITHANGGAVPADVLVIDGKIAKIDSSIDVSGDVTKIKDAGGLWLTPGSVKLGGDKEDENTRTVAKALLDNANITASDLKNPQDTYEYPY